MSVLVVMSQPLRQPKAVSFLRSREPEEHKLVVTRDARLLDISAFPADTKFMSWEAAGGVSSTTLSERLLAKAKTWVRGGSPLGARLERWLRAGEWRLRYLDRVKSVVAAARAADWADAKLVAALEEIAASAEFEDAVVLDLFDLPPLLAVSGRQAWRVRVL